jgi:hypothetical protein
MKKKKNSWLKSVEYIMGRINIYKSYKLMTLVNKVVNTKDFKNKTNEYLF